MCVAGFMFVRCMHAVVARCMPTCNIHAHTHTCVCVARVHAGSMRHAAPAFMLCMQHVIEQMGNWA
jgi:hypothetical protein